MVQAPSSAALPVESSEGEEEQEWEDWEDDQGADFEEEAQSLFDSTRLPSAEAVFEYDAEHHDFNLLAYKHQQKVWLRWLALMPHLLSLSLAPLLLGC